MVALRFGAGDLLEYNPTYSLLICRECQYAIQKNALESHLLRHKIYRGDRQRLLSAISKLNLLEPDNVRLPLPGSPPINGLPILSGYRCASPACGHLTVSTKRMKRHWSESHDLDGSITLSSAYVRPVKLQTFFRGTKVRYFEVSSAIVHLDDANANGGDANNNDVDDVRMEWQDAVEDVIQHTPVPPKSSPSSPLQSLPVPAHVASTASPFQPDFSLETMTYFHHLIITLCRTLPGLGDVQSSHHYWQVHVPALALRRRWLMCGLLAISACHSILVAHEPVARRLHYEREEQFSAEFSSTCPDLKSIQIRKEASSFTAEIGGLAESPDEDAEDEARSVGRQLSHLLRCAQWASSSSSNSHGSVASFRLHWIMSMVRGCIVPSSAACRPGFRDRDDVTSSNVPSVLMDRLRVLPFRLAERLGRPENAEEVLTTLSAIEATVQSCEISFAHDEVETAWQGVVLWLTNVSGHFDRMVENHHPAALVVLAHWAAILVRRAESLGCWFVKGLAEIIVLQVMRHLNTGNCVVLDLVESLIAIVSH